MLDTKSKNSKKFSFIIAGISVGLAVIVYMACYPVFKNQVSSHYTSGTINVQLVEKMYESNLVLYKDILDKAEERSGSYADLYMTIDEEALPKEADTYNAEFENGYTSEELKDYLENEINSLLEEWKIEMLFGLAKGMDYAVIDNTTGEIIKNTGRNIEKLYDGTMNEDENPYVYYVKMAYDSAGNISGITVRDVNSDELLKDVQSVMASKSLKSSLYYKNANINFYRNTIYAYDNKGTPVELSVKIEEPLRNVTFIYAMTKEQKENLNASEGSSFIAGDTWSEKNAYVNAGAGSVYMVIMLVLGFAALLWTRSKKYCLHHLSGFKTHMETEIVGLACLVGFCSIAIDLMVHTNNGYYSGFLAQYVEFMPKALYPVMTGVFNAVVLLLFFGGWYYFVTGLGEIFDFGIWQFIRERSLIVRFCSWFLGGCRAKRDKLRTELLHADLGEKADGILKKLLLINYIVLAVISFTWAFGWVLLIVYSIVLYIGIKKYIGSLQEQYEKLLKATESIAEGNLNTALNEDFGIFESLKEELLKIQNGFKKAVNEEVKSQRMKTELITNVSHDLKTPLTAITTYIELLEDETITEEQRKEYLGVLKKKSARLKFLIEDLFEVSKATTGNVTLNPVDVDICNLMRQVYLEYEDKVEEADLIFRFSLPEEKVILRLDSQKTFRVFENLYINIIKYAMPHTRVYINGVKTEKGIRIELKNMSASELNMPPEDLTERFVRGDSSRNTEGSGLGLAIARSFTELQGGELKVEIDGDLFKVILNFK